MAQEPFFFDLVLIVDPIKESWDIESYNCNLSSPEVKLQLNLKYGRRPLKPEKSGSSANN
jgi:hypothetical protein